MKTAILVMCLTAAVFSLTCDSPLLNVNNNRLAPTAGVLEESEAASDDLAFCSNLAGEQVCCGADAFDSM